MASLKTGEFARKPQLWQLCFETEVFEIDPKVSLGDLVMLENECLCQIADLLPDESCCGQMCFISSV